MTARDLTEAERTLPAHNFKNKLINGLLNINQREVSGTVVLLAGEYGHDRYKAGASGCTYTFATVENVTTITITVGSLIQVVEGLNLLSGIYTLSWEGTSQCKIDAGLFGDSGISATLIGGTNATIEIGTGTFSKPQLEEGNTATPFENRPIGVELALCQRYYETLNGRVWLSLYADISSKKSLSYTYKVTKRIIPTVVATFTDGTVLYGIQSENVAIVYASDATTVSATQVLTLVADAEL